jgi:hypothetical protein
MRVWTGLIWLTCPGCGQMLINIICYYMNMLINLRIPQNAGNFLANRRGCLSRRTLLHAVREFIMTKGRREGKKVKHNTRK